MASEGPNNPSTAANDSAIGTVAWSNPTNVYSSDNNKASASIAGSNSQYCKATNFGFSIPTDATINGIVVEGEIMRTVAAGDCADYSIKCCKGGTIQGNDNKRPITSYWPSSDTYVSWGNSTDTWGISWTYSDINATGFGFGIAAQATGVAITAYIDHMRVTVYYTESGGGGDAMPMAQTRYAQLRS